MVLVIIRTQEQVHLVEVIMAETRDRSIMRTVQFEVDNLGPGKALPAVLIVLDDLRVKRQDALNSSGLPGTTDAHERESLRGYARSGTEDRIFFYKMESPLRFSPESQIERISPDISCPDHP